MPSSNLHSITSPATPIDFNTAILRATAVADELFGDNMPLGE